MNALPLATQMALTLGPTTAAIVDALVDVPIGGEITYVEIAAAAGVDDFEMVRSNLSSARRVAQRERGAVFVPMRGVGLRRLEPDQAAVLGQAARHKIRRSSRRAVTSMLRLANASNGLAPDAQRAMTREISALGLIGEISNDKVAMKLGDGEKVTPAAVTADAFRQMVAGGKTSGETAG